MKAFSLVLQHHEINYDTERLSDNQFGTIAQASKSFQMFPLALYKFYCETFATKGQKNPLEQKGTKTMLQAEASAVATVTSKPKDLSFFNRLSALRSLLN